jgi:hypothetical protein
MLYSADASFAPAALCDHRFTRSSPTFLLKSGIFSSGFMGGSYTAVYSVEYQGNLSHRARKIVLPTNNADNTERRINVEDYRAGEVFGDLADTFDFGREESGVVQVFGVLRSDVFR